MSIYHWKLRLIWYQTHTCCQDKDFEGFYHWQHCSELSPTHLIALFNSLYQGNKSYMILVREQPEKLGMKRKSCPRPTHVTLNEWRLCYLPYFYSAVFVSMVTPWRGKWRQPGQSQLHSLHPGCFPSFFPNCSDHSEFLHPLKISIQNHLTRQCNQRTTRNQWRTEHLGYTNRPPNTL